MTKMIFASLPVTDLRASIAFYRARGSPAQDQGFTHGRGLADPDGNLWGASRMAPAARPEQAR